MSESFQSRLTKSQQLSQHVIIPFIREHEVCNLGPCRHATQDEDMIDKVDVVCEHCCDPQLEVHLGIRCQVGRYSHFRTHTLRCTEIERMRDRSWVPPDWLVHAYMRDECTILRIGLIEGPIMQQIVQERDIRLRDVEGTPARMGVIEWAEHPGAFTVLEPGGYSLLDRLLQSLK